MRLPANAFYKLALTVINWSNERTNISFLSQNTTHIDTKCIRHANAVTIKVCFFYSEDKHGLAQS